MIEPRGFLAVEEYPEDKPGWYDIQCELCDEWAGTDGLETVVEDWAYEHMEERHPRRLRRWGNRL